MDPHPSWQISQALGCRPTLLKAERKCACARNRLFWCDFEIIPGDSEHLSRGPNANELSLAWAEEEERLGILEEGWEFHPQFSGVLPTFLGWRQWASNSTMSEASPLRITSRKSAGPNRAGPLPSTFGMTTTCCGRSQEPRSGVRSPHFVPGRNGTGHGVPRGLDHPLRFIR